MKFEKQQLGRIHEIFKNALGLDLGGDDLTGAAISVARFVCVKELRNYKLKRKEANERRKKEQKKTTR